jgi:hypothetical protein
LAFLGKTGGLSLTNPFADKNSVSRAGENLMVVGF